MNKEKFDLFSKTINKVLKEKPRITLKGRRTKLKEYRVGLNISGKEAAKRLHLSYRNYYRIENNDKVPGYVQLLIKQGAMIEHTSQEVLSEWWSQLGQ